MMHNNYPTGEQQPGSARRPDDSDYRLSDNERVIERLRRCREFAWTVQTLAGVSIEELRDIEVWCQTMQQLASEAAKQQLLALHGDDMPADVQLLCTGEQFYAWAGPEHHALTLSAAQHVVAIAPFAHISPRLKQRLRRIVGSHQVRQ